MKRLRYDDWTRTLESLPSHSPFLPLSLSLSLHSIGWYSIFPLTSLRLKSSHENERRSNDCSQREKKKRGREEENGGMRELRLIYPLSLITCEDVKRWEGKRREKEGRREWKRMRRQKKSLDHSIGRSVWVIKWRRKRDQRGIRWNDYSFRREKRREEGRRGADDSH